MAEKYSKNSDSGCMSTDWTYNPNYSPAQKADYDYKQGIVATLNASAVTKDGSVPAYSAGAPSDKSK